MCVCAQYYLVIYAHLKVFKLNFTHHIAHFFELVDLLTPSLCCAKPFTKLSVTNVCVQNFNNMDPTKTDKPYTDDFGLSDIHHRMASRLLVAQA